MLLKDRLVKTGHTFFKYRSYQFVFIILIVLAEHASFKNSPDNIYWEMFSVFVTLIGVVIRALTVGFVHEKTSGRNTKAQNAHELNSTGAYSTVRNPLYVGNYMTLLGVLLLSQNAEIVILGTIAFIATYIPIILTEESYLLEKFGDTYKNFAKNVNCAIPSFKNFTRPAREFSFNMLLKREHDSWMTAAVSLLIMKVVREYFSKDMLTFSSLEPVWYGFIGSVTVIWLLLKVLKKTGKLLVPAERKS